MYSAKWISLQCQKNCFSNLSALSILPQVGLLGFVVLWWFFLKKEQTIIAIFKFVFYLSIICKEGCVSQIAAWLEYVSPLWSGGRHE